MKPRKKRKKRTRKKEKVTRALSGREALQLYTQLSQLGKKLDRMAENSDHLAARLEDAEIHINLLTRFITTICVEKIGMRIGVLKRLLKRVEREAVRDSQILHLESLYNLPQGPHKQPFQKPSSKKDPWEDIS